jgi:hypothetical protein
LLALSLQIIDAMMFGDFFVTTEIGGREKRKRAKISVWLIIIFLNYNSEKQ